MSVPTISSVEVSEEGVDKKVPEEGTRRVALGNASMSVNLARFPEGALDRETSPSVEALEEPHIYLRQSISSEDGPKDLMVQAAEGIRRINPKGIQALAAALGVMKVPL